MENKKEFMSVEEQIKKLRSKGLIITDEAKAKQLLLQNNYFTLINGYKTPFLLNSEDSDDSKTKFIEGTTFEEVYALFRFDCQVRALFFKYILNIEHNIKSVIAHVFAGKHRDEPYPQYLNEKNFDVNKDGKLVGNKQIQYQILREYIDSEITRQLAKDSSVIQHYKNKHHGNYPLWVLINLLSFGQMRYFYTCLNNKDQNDIGRVFSLYPNEMQSYLAALNIYRNACAHDERIYNQKLINRVPIKMDSGEKREFNKVYVLVLIIKAFLPHLFNDFYRQLNDHIEILAKQLHTITIDTILKEMGIPSNHIIRKNELGRFDRGDTLPNDKFMHLVRDYLLPMLPINSEVYEVSRDDPIIINKSCDLLLYKDNRIYLAQSIDNDFICYIPIEKGTIITQQQITQLNLHMMILVDYIHIFWYEEKTTIFGEKSSSVTFSVICEHMFELSICKIVSEEKNNLLTQEYIDLHSHLKQSLSKKSENEQVIQELKIALVDKKKEINKAIISGSIIEETLCSIINLLESWSTRTYEGKKKTFGIIVQDEPFEGKGSFNYLDFLSSDYSATITDGEYSGVMLYANGMFSHYIKLDKTKDTDIPSVPIRYSAFAKQCNKDRIGIILTDNGDILLIKDKKLRYTKHNGHWLPSMTDSMINLLKQKIGKMSFAKEIAQSIVDVSFRRGGACLCIIKENTVNTSLLERIAAGAFENSEHNKKTTAIKGLVSSSDHNVMKFYELDKNLRSELLELDGATVFSYDGTIHAVGTIVILNPIKNLYKERKV